jgi:WD40 repeat protein
LRDVLDGSEQVASGILWNAWDAHYRRVSVLRFTSDGFGLLSGSDDAGISVWSISEYVCHLSFAVHSLI